MACRACAAHLIYYVWQKMRLAHFLPDIINVVLSKNALRAFLHNTTNLLCGEAAEKNI
jgi:hypothetical protein